jgi:hypothetical protein
LTRAQISSLVLSWLDDVQQGYFDATSVNTWINLSQRQVQMELLQAGQNWYEQRVTTSTVVGQQDYQLPSDFMVLHRLEIVISGTGTNENRQPLTPITINQQDMVSIPNGTPTNYIMNKDRVTIYPAPQQVYTMRMYYSYRVADLVNDSDVPDIPEQFMEYSALLAAFDGFIRDDRAPENLITKKSKYENLLQQMKNDRSQDVARQVVTVNEFDYGAWF